MDDYIEKLQKFYKKNKKKSGSNLGSNSIQFIRTPYYYNKDYLRDIENKILEEKNKILKLKYNIFYELDNSEEQIQEYDILAKRIQELKQEENKIKLKIEHKEDTIKQKINKIKEQIEVLKMNYKTVPEDKKEFYLTIQEDKDKLIDILKDNISIIKNEKNKKTIFVLTTDYEPIIGNEITVDTFNSDSNTSNSNSNSNSSNSNSNSNSNSKKSKRSNEVNLNEVNLNEVNLNEVNLNDKE